MAQPRLLWTIDSKAEAIGPPEANYQLPYVRMQLVVGTSSLLQYCGQLVPTPLGELLPVSFNPGMRAWEILFQWHWTSILCTNRGVLEGYNVSHSCRGDS